jgi:hypothetical protein
LLPRLALLATHLVDLFLDLCQLVLVFEVEFPPGFHGRVSVSSPASM